MFFTYLQTVNSYRRQPVGFPSKKLEFDHAFGVDTLSLLKTIPSLDDKWTILALMMHNGSLVFDWYHSKDGLYYSVEDIQKVKDHMSSLFCQ